MTKNTREEGPTEKPENKIYGNWPFLRRCYKENKDKKDKQKRVVTIPGAAHSAIESDNNPTHFSKGKQGEIRRIFVPGVGEKNFRSCLCVRGESGFVMTLLVQHVEGKASGTRKRNKITESGKAAIKEAEGRYPTGSSALVKIAVRLSQSGEVSEVFGLKCFFYDPSSNVACIKANAGKEAEAWRLLGHFAAVLMRDCGGYREGHNRVYLLVPYFNGGDLHTRCLRRFFVSLNKKIADEIQVLHLLYRQLQELYLKHRLVNTDLKLENVVFHLGQDGRLSVTMIDCSLIKAGSEVGYNPVTPGYLSPEKALMVEDKDKRRSIRFDWSDTIYAFGIIAVRMLGCERETPENRVLRSNMMLLFFNQDVTKRVQPKESFASIGAALFGHNTSRNNPYTGVPVTYCTNTNQSSPNDAGGGVSPMGLSSSNR